MERQKTFSFGKQTRTFYTLHILRPWATEQWLSWTRLTIPAGGGGGGPGHIRWSEVNTFLTLSWTEWLTSGDNQLMHEKAKNVFCRGKFGEIPLNTQWCHCSSSLIVCVCVLKRHRCEDKRLQRSRGFISFQNASYHALNGQKTNTTNYDKNNKNNIFKKELGQNLIASKNTKKTKQNNNKREQKCTN